MLLTEQVCNYVFAIKKNDNDNDYSVLLLNTQKSEHIITAIDKVNEWNLIELLRKGKLQLFIKNGASDDRIISVCDKSIFCERFISALNLEERNEPLNDRMQYWFSEDIYVPLVGNDDYYDDRGDDDWDYKRETCDAMTDGMYGDMPDGFDGDYDYLG